MVGVRRLRAQAFPAVCIGCLAVLLCTLTGLQTAFARSPLGAGMADQLQLSAHLCGTSIHLGRPSSNVQRHFFSLDNGEAERKRKAAEAETKRRDLLTKAGGVVFGVVSVGTVVTQKQSNEPGKAGVAAPGAAKVAPGAAKVAPGAGTAAAPAAPPAPPPKPVKYLPWRIGKYESQLKEKAARMEKIETNYEATAKKDAETRDFRQKRKAKEDAEIERAKAASLQRKRDDKKNQDFVAGRKKAELEKSKAENDARIKAAKEQAQREGGFTLPWGVISVAGAAGIFAIQQNKKKESTSTSSSSKPAETEKAPAATPPAAEPPAAEPPAAAPADAEKK